MNTIQFKEVNCKSCYKCIRSCPVKAISVKNDHAQVIEEGCIFCNRVKNDPSIENLVVFKGLQSFVILNKYEL